MDVSAARSAFFSSGLIGLMAITKELAQIDEFVVAVSETRGG
jgi:hypothetical protein